MGASGVNGGRVFSATLTNELVEPMAEVLHLACAQDTTHSHQLGVMRVVMTTSWTWVGMATNSQHRPLDLWSFGEPWQAWSGCSHSWGRWVSKETGQPFWGQAGGWRRDGDVRLASRCRVFILLLVNELAEEVQPEEKIPVRWVKWEHFWIFDLFSATCRLWIGKELWLWLTMYR